MKENLVEAMMEQKRKREAPLPTREDFIELAVEELKALLPKNPKLANKRANESDELRNERDRMLKNILANTDSSHPEQNHDFITHIPEMHLSWPTLATICKNSNFLDVYAIIVSALYKNNSNHSAEQERIWLAMDSEELIRHLSIGGMEWSRSSKLMIEKQYPVTYNRLFAPKHYVGFFD